MERIAQQQILASLCITALYLVLFCGSIVYSGNRLLGNASNEIASLNSAEEKRIMYLELLRIVAAFSVIFLHVNATRMNGVSISSFRYAVFVAFAMLSRYCVPLFLMISGVFFLDNSRPMSFKKLFCHNIKHIVCAFLFWSFVHATYTIVCRYLYTNKSISFDPLNFIRMVITGEYGYSHLQFMFYLIGCYLLVPFMRKITEKKENVLYYLGLAIIFGFGLNTMQQFTYMGEVFKFLSKFDISFVCGYTGYFFAGYYLHKYELSSKIKITIYFLAILALITTVYLTMVRSFEINTVYTRLLNYKGLPVFLESCGLFLLFKQCFGNVHFGPAKCQIISSVSALTFGVYLCHYMILLELSRHGMNQHLFTSLLSVPFFTCVIFILSLAVIWLLRKIPFMKFVS